MNDLSRLAGTAGILETLRVPEAALACEAHRNWNPSRLSQEI